MNTSSNIVITGAAGFIGSCLVGFLNREGYDRLILVDDFSKTEKESNLSGKRFTEKVERDIFFEWLGMASRDIGFIFHMGARTDTTEFDYAVHERLNLEYSKKIWEYASAAHIPVVYASSAATYGSGQSGYSDDESLIESLAPLNPYGVSKNEFDKWALREVRAENHPPAWAGLKFFNVYGPNEYHKARMASVIFHSYNQIRKNGSVRLFKSHKKEFRDGEQLRDFIYVKDVLKICSWFLECWQRAPATFTSGIFNVGTGKARSFNDLARATFSGLDQPVNIEYTDMPEDIRDTYQYFTEAEMAKIRSAGYHQSFYSLEEGVGDYVRNYLAPHTYY
jgi:ADP-L-glycero-D-manno-heptose 6-epimerase